MHLTKFFQIFQQNDPPAPDDPRFYTLGLNGTGTELRVALKTAQENFLHIDSFVSCHHSKRMKRILQESIFQLKELHRGATAACIEGRFDNIQIILTEHAEIYSRAVYNRRSSALLIETITNLVRDVPNPEAAVKNALAKMHPADQNQQKILNNLLMKAIDEKHSETNIAALLKAGAQANARDGLALAKAVENNTSVEIVKLLHENGASFADALFLIQVNGRGKQTDIKLRAYERKITGKTEISACDEKTHALIEQLQQQIKDLTEKLEQKLPPTAPPQPPTP